MDTADKLVASSLGKQLIHAGMWRTYANAPISRRLQIA